ncbi:hypothetical protein [Streptosporangium sp. NPDC000396]|uniref:hypothetical protein n=1 Tax=Streptosporangium sp. NPDC000396 TaxID=3366185 RepID=UPI00367A289B
MRQLRRGAPFGWLFALLFPLFVSAGLGGGGITAFSPHTTIAKVAGERPSPSREALAGWQRQAFVTGLTGTGAGGGPSPAAHVPDTRPPSLTPGFDSRPARDNDSSPLAALLVRPGRAPPSTDN